MPITDRSPVAGVFPRRPGGRLVPAGALLLAAILAVTGCADGDRGPDLTDPPAATTSGTPDAGLTPDSTSAPDAGSLVATARVPSVAVRTAPDDAGRTLTNPTTDGSPLTFMVLERRPGLLRVQLPVRPNGSTGWISAEQVELTRTPYRLIVHRGRHLLEVLTDGRRSAQYPVGIGTSVNPTPSGTYYLTELLAVPDPHGAYGPYAFGLSAFSPTLTSFAGGPGQLGLHGTNQPATVGSDVSHGCLRVTNDVISALARQLPLGTPVEITPT